MKKLQRQKGFTLVELAIVLTIIGLLLGGVLKGQQLINNARVTSQIAQIKAVEVAVTTFNDTYGFLPGDLPAADTRVPNCASCIATSNGDGIVSAGISAPAVAWDGKTTTMLSTPFTTFEAASAFLELAGAGLMSGVTPNGGTAPALWGGAFPQAKVPGGLLLGYMNIAATGVPTAGTYVAIVQSTTTAVSAVLDGNVLTPSQAAQIDRKIDDGVSSTGDVIGLGLAASCHITPVAAATPSGYLETSQTKDCSLVAKVQG